MASFNSSWVARFIIMVGCMVWFGCLLDNSHAESTLTAMRMKMPPAIVIARRVAKDKSFVKVMEHPYEVDLEGMSKLFEFLPQKPLVKDDGVILQMPLLLVVDEYAAWEIDGDAPTIIRIPPSKQISAGRARAIALSCAKRLFPWFWEIPGRIKSIELPTRELDSNGFYTFHWQNISKVEGYDLPVADISIKIRCWDGKVGRFDVALWHGLEGAGIRVSPKEAIQKAISMMQSKLALRNVRVHLWTVRPGGIKRAEVVHYCFTELSAEDALGERFLIEGGVIIDARTGKVESAGAICGPRPFFKPRNVVVEDSLPLWTSKGLVFVSERSLAGMPSWARFPKQLFLLDRTGKIWYLTADMDASAKYLSAMANSPWIAVERGGRMGWGWAYVLNLESGQYRCVSNPNRRLWFATISDGGRYVVGCEGFELVIRDLSHEGKDGFERMVLVMEGEVYLPTFSPDGRWLYCILRMDKKRHSLVKVSLEGLRGQEMGKDVVQVIIEELPGMVDRMSIFPNGEQLVMEIKGKGYWVDIRGKKMEALEFDGLRDRELGGARLLRFCDFCAGPEEGLVTFSGKTIDAEGKVRWRIYTCRLDGKDLRALTPAQDEPVRAYVFGDGQKNALDIAREWAIQEVKWELKHRLEWGKEY